jgi:NADH-quinone oxidoreductase subunit L
VLPNEAGEGHEGGLALVTAAVPIVGLVVGWLLFVRLDFWRSLAEAPFGRAIRSFLHQGWAFDVIYDVLIVKPFVAVARANKKDVVDLVFTGTAALSRALHRALAFTQNGRLRWYAANMAAGLVVVLLVVLGVL